MAHAIRQIKIGRVRYIFRGLACLITFRGDEIAPTDRERGCESPMPQVAWGVARPDKSQHDARRHRATT